MADPDRHFVVSFRDPREEGQGITTLRAREVRDSELGLGFVAISGLLFDTGRVIVDPKSDALRARYEGVQRLHLALHAIVAVEEVGADNAGLGLAGDRSNLVVLRPPGGEDGPDA